jgi:hypothetical protein
MTYFPEIIRILDRFREPRIETLDGEFRTSTADKSFQLYDGIRTGRFPSDHAAAGSLYSSSPTDPKYSTLKSRLKWRLLNTLFHLNLQRAGFSEYATALYKVYRRAFLAHTLLILGARTTAMKLAEKTLRESLEYQFPLVAVQMGTLLRTHASLTGSITQYNKYDSTLKEQLAQLHAETLSWEYYERAVAVLGRKVSPGQDFLQHLASNIEELQDLRHSVESVTFATNLFRMSLMYANATLNRAGAVEVSQDAIEYLKRFPRLVAPARIAEFAAGKLEAYSALQDFQNAALAAAEGATYVGKGSNNWFTFSERQFQLLMLSRKFVEAENLYEEVTQHTRFAALPPYLQERWKIFELYLQFALQTVPEYETLPLRKKFDLQAFLRFIPVASKDKHGMYVAVLIIHILYMLEAGDFGGIIDRMDALRTYRSRYLRGKSNRRSALFFRLLTVMENNSFNYTLTRQKSERIYKQLRSTAIEAPETNEEIQIIPYEWLWERVMTKLKEYEEVGLKR